jgi:diacylglycerol kinase family enzyme
LEELLAQHGAGRARWLETTPDEPGPSQARQAVEAGATLVMVWGGDGTMIGVASALAGTGVPLGILPGGTANLFARNLGIPLGLDGAVATAVGGRTRTVDLLDVDLGGGEHRVSAVMSGAGWDAEMMAAPESRKRRFGWGAYAIEGVRSVRQRPMQLRVTVDDGPELRLSGRTVLIANVGMLVAGMMLVPEASADDGLLDVLVIDPSTPLDWVRSTAGILSRSALNDPSRTHLRGREVVVRTGHVRKRQIDGDLVSPGASLHVRVLPAALDVRVPASRPRGTRRLGRGVADGDGSRRRRRAQPPQATRSSSRQTFTTRR